MEWMQWGKLSSWKIKSRGTFWEIMPFLRSLPGAGVTNCHKPGGLKQEKWLLTQCGSQKSEIQVGLLQKALGKNPPSSHRAFGRSLQLLGSIP